MNNDVVPKTTHEVHGEKFLDPAFQRSNKHTFSVSLKRNFLQDGTLQSPPIDRALSLQL